MSALRKPLPEFEPEREVARDGSAMSFIEHLEELRHRLIVCLAALVIGFAVACLFADRLFEFVMTPLRDALPKGATLIYTEPLEGMSVWLQIAAVAGLFLVSPVILWQVWLFIAPGLYAREKRLAIPFVLCATACFVAGAAFSHYVAFPAASVFFASFSTEYVEFRPRVGSSFSLYIRMLLGFAAVFQMPTITMFLARLGVLTSRWLVQHTKYAILVIFIAAAFISTTTDPMGQLMMAIPMMILYGISIGVAWICEPRKKSPPA